MNELSSVQKWMELSYEWQLREGMGGMVKSIFWGNFGLRDFKAEFIDFF